MRTYIAALRSGNYQQCFGEYFTKHGNQVIAHCAIGVAIEVSGLSFADELAKWLGIYSGQLGDVVNMNDKGRFDFGQIADELEEIYLPQDWQATREQRANGVPA